MEAKQSMDVFGQALKAYCSGDKSKFYLKEPSGKLWEHSLERYFRKENQLSKFERKLISLSYGDILDVGCGTGNYMSSLNKHGKALGIDISKNVINVARLNGCKNCIVTDIFTFSTENKFDTITFLENNLGLGGSLDKTRELFKKLSILLKNNGQILAISKNLDNKDCFPIELTPVWKNIIGPKFTWIHFNTIFLSALCKKEGFYLEILQRNRHSYLVRIVKKQFK
jgi:2-polyprenyl-3-methyl-5-hydroxy-6-metoxy-1,4-benzoquinol methylase